MTELKNLIPCDRVRIERFNEYLFCVAGWERPSGNYYEKTVASARDEAGLVEILLKLKPIRPSFLDLAIAKLLTAG
jgi:hypothetical protein